MKDTRDSALYPPFSKRNYNGNLFGRSGARRLKHLAKEHLGVQIQDGRHDPAEDARSSLYIYKKFQKEWDTWIHDNYKKAKHTLRKRQRRKVKPRKK